MGIELIFIIVSMCKVWEELSYLQYLILSAHFWLIFLSIFPK